jgi:hypothetical protein
LQVDLYAPGMTMLAVLTGKVPFEDVPLMTIIRQAGTKSLPLPQEAGVLPSELSRGARGGLSKLLKSMTCHKLSDRPTAEGVAERLHALVESDAASRSSSAIDSPLLATAAAVGAKRSRGSPITRRSMALRG